MYSSLLIKEKSYNCFRRTGLLHVQLEFNRDLIKSENIMLRIPKICEILIL